MCSPSARAISCPEHARLEGEYLAALHRMRSLIRLRQVTRVSRSAAAEKEDERRLADEVAMAIARLKEHVTEHDCQR